MNTYTKLPPTPAEFAALVARRYGPPQDPQNPFLKPDKIAAERLLIRALAETLGPQDPLSQFLLAYDSAHTALFPVNLRAGDGETALSALEDMGAAWEVIEQDVADQAERLL